MCINIIFCFVLLKTIKLKIRQFLFLSYGDNLHEMSNPIFYANYEGPAKSFVTGFGLL